MTVDRTGWELRTDRFARLAVVVAMIAAMFVVIPPAHAASHSLSISDAVAVTEGGTSSFTVTLTLDPVTPVTVDYVTADVTAVAPGDYTAIPLQTLTFNPGGSLTQTIDVFTNNDALNEATETFSVILSNPTNATISDPSGLGTINDDGDLAPTVSIADGSATEGSAVSFNVTLTAASGQVVRQLCNV